MLLLISTVWRWPLPFIRIRFHREHKVGDAADALFDRADELHAGDQRIQPTQSVGEACIGKLVAGTLQLLRIDADRDQRRRHLPGILDVGLLHPMRQRLFRVALFKRVHMDRLFGSQSVLLQIEHALLLFLAQFEAAELRRQLVHPQQIFPELRGSPARRGSRVVQFVHQSSGQRSQRRHLLLLNGDALQLLNPRRHVAEDGLAHIGATGHQPPEAILIELKQMSGLRNPEADRIRSVRQQRHLAEGISAGDRSKGDLLAIGKRLDEAKLALQQYPEMVSYFALPDEQFAYRQMDLLRVFEAAQFFVAQATTGWEPCAIWQREHRSSSEWCLVRTDCVWLLIIFPGADAFQSVARY